MKTMIAFVLGLLFSANVLSQNFLELRGADSRYRYADWAYTAPNHLTVDVTYVGLPGTNEVSAGLGYLLKPHTSLSITPLAYVTVGREGGQRGAKLALLGAWEHRGWKAAGFLAQYIPARGDIKRYLVLDTLDATRGVGKRWDVGVSWGFFHQDRGWNSQVGPLIRRNDRRGAWTVSWRTGSTPELRLTRTFTFGPP